ncbi:hypothetical protein COV82_03370 [Candidatus Peregrinibacteria bacterium CG11_big_fil_rev_8_21_14_0_20_46_8]|nr:MAG: hypothetical protein COV82_03370 [Candidatus Peregrinibacteria bacterium CG11_big_fil_rev_8_21_14_0_20_46_8]
MKKASRNAHTLDSGKVNYLLIGMVLGAIVSALFFHYRLQQGQTNLFYSYPTYNTYEKYQLDDGKGYSSLDDGKGFTSLDDGKGYAY